jgi:hypothetical protein
MKRPRTVPLMPNVTLWQQRELLLAVRNFVMRLYTIRATLYFYVAVQFIAHVGLVGCNAVWTCRWIPTFRRNILPPSSEGLHPWRCRQYILPKGLWRWRQYVPPKRCQPTSAHGVITHRTNVYILPLWELQISYSAVYCLYKRPHDMPLHTLLRYEEVRTERCAFVNTLPVTGRVSNGNVFQSIWDYFILCHYFMFHFFLWCLCRWWIMAMWRTDDEF